MGIKFASVALNSPSSAVVQDFTVSGFGTADAAIFLTSFGTTAGSQQAAIQASIGFCANNGTTTTQHVSAATVQNAVTTTNTYRRYATDEVCMRVDTAGAIRAEANWDSWITDGVKINWADPDNQTTRKVVAILIQDTEATAKFYCGQFTPNATQNGSVDVTDLAAQADLVFFTGSYTSTLDTSIDGAKLFFGIWERGAGAQYSLSWYSEDGVSGEQVGSYLSNARCGVEVAEAGVGAGLECVENVDGFRVFTRDAAGTNFGVVGYLAVNFVTRHQTNLGSYRIPTGTGTDATTGVGFEPDFLLGIQSHVTALNTLTQGSTGGVFGVGFSNLSAEDSASFECEDAAATTDTNSVWNSVFHHTVRGDTDGDQIGTVSAVGADGFTINWTSAAVATQGIGVYLALTNDVALPTEVAVVTVEAFEPDVTAAASLPIPTGEVSAVAFEPDIDASGAIEMPTGTVAVEAIEPDVTAAASLDVPVATVSVTAIEPEMSVRALLAPDAPAVVLVSAPDVTIEAAATVDVPVAEGFVTALKPTVVLGLPGDDFVDIPTAQVSAVALAPAVSASAFLRPGSPTVAVLALAPALDTVTGDTLIAVATATASVVAFAPTLQGPVTAGKRAPGHTQLRAPHFGRAQGNTR